MAASMHTSAPARMTGWRSLARLLALCLACVSFSACEKSGGGGSNSLGKGFDFGINDPEVVLAIGDSITSGNGDVPYSHYLAPMIDKAVVNEGRDGTVSSDGAQRIQSLLSSDTPGFTVIMYGANDVIHARPLDTTLENLRQIVWTCKLNQSLPILCTVTPQIGPRAFVQDRINNLNTGIRQLAREEGVVVADVARAFRGQEETLISSDNLHPGDMGYLVIAETIAAVF